MQELEKLDQIYTVHTTDRLPLAVQKGEGNYLYDVNNKRYLDLFTGLGVNIVGHRHPSLMKALTSQAERFLHVSNLFYNPQTTLLAKRLVDCTVGKGKVYFGNSGTEATEALLKIISKWTRQHREKKSGIVVLKNSFHGRTLGALHLTSQKNVRQDFPRLNLPIIEVEPNDLQAIHKACEHNVAAILIEPILGSGGVMPLSADYLKTIQKICTDQNILLCIDEIQTGLGRTGTLFCYQQHRLQPDLILFAKAMGGGLPLGGVICGEKAQNVFQSGDHGSTFGPSPLSIAMGHALLDILSEGLLDSAQEVICYLWERLTTLKNLYPLQIDTIHGQGMMIGIHTHLSKEAVKVIQMDLLREGFLVNITAKTVIRLLPPLTLLKKEIDSFCYCFEKILNT